MSVSELTLAVFNTLAVLGLSTVLAVPIGALLAIALQRSNMHGRSWAWVALGSQLALPLYVFAGGWSAGMGLQGWMRWRGSSLLGLAIFGSAIESGAGSIVAVSAIHALAAIPWVCIIVSMGLIWAHRSQEEAAIVDGGQWQLLQAGLWPKLRIWIAASCLWCAMPVLTEMVVTNLYQVPTVAEQIYLDASRGSISSWTYISSVLLCMLPIVAVGLLISRYSPKWSDVAASLNHFRGRAMELGKYRVLVSSLAWTMVLLLVVLPMINLLIKAGWKPYVDTLGLTHYGWSAGRLLTTVRESLTLYSAEFYWSAMLAGCSTLMALGLATICRLCSRSRVAQIAVSLLALVMLAVPGPLVGMLIIALMNRSQPAWLGTLYDTTLAAPMLAQQFRLFPLSWLLSLTILGSVSTQTWEQAELDGLRGMPLFSKIVWPQTWSRWLIAAMILVVLSIGELSCSILVLPPGVTTLSMRLFEMLHFGMRHQDSGLCGVLIVLGWLISLASWKTLSER